MQSQTVIFIGPQGSGKGTQVERLTAYLHENSPEQAVVPIETGKAFRDLAQTHSFTARRVKELLSEGKLIPNFITKAFVVKFLIKNLEDNTHLTMDGFPRNLAQVQFIDDLMKFYNRDALSVVFLDVPEEVVRKRMKGRGRADDTPELIDERLRLYKEQTEPIVSAYKNRDDINFVHIDGTLPIAGVTQKMIEGLAI